MYALSGGEILNILKWCPVTTHLIKGIKTRDIPVPKKIGKTPAIYVVNTGYARAGVHWVLALFNSSHNIFFDSFGRSPKELLLASQLDRINTSVLFNTKKLQHPKSSVCGHWVIYYTYFLCKGHSLSEISSQFSSTNFKANDKIVFNFVKKLAISCQAPLKNLMSR